MNKLYKSKKWLEQRIYKDRMTPTEIANYLGVSPQTIYTWAEKHGIKV